MKMRHKLKANYYYKLMSLIGLYMHDMIKSIEMKTNRDLEVTINADVRDTEMIIRYDIFTNSADILFNISFNIDGGEYIEVSFSEFEYNDDVDELYHIYNKIGGFIIEYIKLELNKVKNIKTKSSRYTDDSHLIYLIKLNDLELFLKKSYFEESLIDLLLI